MADGDDKVEGREFSPTEKDEDETASTTTQGSGRKFAPDVQDVDTDERARQTKSSGKEFAPDVHLADEDEPAEGEGSGKQFEPDE